MKPYEREDKRYSGGGVTKIGKEEKEMIKALSKKRGRLLDVGCGSGEVSSHLKDLGFDVYGLDFSEAGVKLAQQKRINAKQHDIDSGLPFDDNYFDAVWCGDIVEHVFDPIFLFKEIKRVLKKDGEVLLTVPNEMWLPARINGIFGYSPQSSIYRNYGQCKHHTIMSLELLSYFLEISDFKMTYFNSICVLPKTSIEFFSSNKFLASLFGRVFIVKLMHVSKN